jgi:hypothetical protein
VLEAIWAPSVDLQFDKKILDNGTAMRGYNLVYNMCTQKPPHNLSERLYHATVQNIDTHLREVMLPALLSGLWDGKTASTAAAFAGMWCSFRRRCRWFISIFRYLDRFFTKRLELPSIKETLCLLLARCMPLDFSLGLAAISKSDANDA